MHETILSRSLRRSFGAAGLGLPACLLLCLPAVAQEAARPPECQVPPGHKPV